MAGGVMASAETPEYIRQAASRIAGTALGPFIMGERHVDLEALEKRINERVIEEMARLAAALIASLAHTSVIVMVDEVEKQPKAAKKKPKAKKSAAGQNLKEKTGKK